MRRTFTAIAALAVLGMLATSALAAVDFDSETGLGFSGKGDVQLAFGWNNKTLNDNAPGVTFQYVESTVKIQDCVERERGTITSRREDVVRTTGVASTVAHDTRSNRKGDITGFNLNGLGSSTSLSSGGCLDGETPNGPATETTVAELQAVHNSVAKGIWSPPAAE